MKAYKKAQTRLEKAVNLKAKEIAMNFKMHNRIKCVPKNTAFISLNDHKSNFRVAAPCCLINSCKSELGKISKIILESVNMVLVEIWNANQWKNTDMIISWFKSIERKPHCIFIQFVAMEFYPSITEKILNDAITFGKEYM